MTERAVISLIGHDRPGIVSDLTAIVSAQGANIEDTRAATLGLEFAVMIGLQAEAAALDTIENELRSLAADRDMELLFRRTGPARPVGELAEVSVTSMDHPGIVHSVTRFFAAADANILELDTQTRPAAHTGTPTFDLQMLLALPAGCDFNALAAQFDDHCGEQTLDGTMQRKVT